MGEKDRVFQPELWRPGETRWKLYVPLEAPLKDIGRHRLPEAIRYMRRVIRTKQETTADFYRYTGQLFDWKGDLSKKWMPDNGVYRPGVDFKRDRFETMRLSPEQTGDEDETKLPS